MKVPASLEASVIAAEMPLVTKPNLAKAVVNDEESDLNDEEAWAVSTLIF